VNGEPRRGFFPALEPYGRGMLTVSELHTLYYEQSGNPAGKPVVVLHGGPGGGSDAKHRRFFDPSVYRIILFDQRGCGRSTPHASLDHNTTWDLVADLERLRVHLGVEQWQLFGGSWGSTLALAYAQTHPERVTEMILRGIFMLRADELRWFYQDGANAMFPEAWEGFIEPIPPDERGDLVAAYHRRLTSDDPQVVLRAARAWTTWETTTSFLLPNPASIEAAKTERFAIAFARIECHYFVNRGFFARDGQLLQDIERIRHIPATIIQGRYDIVCPMLSAWDLHKAWPEANFVLVPDAGHSAYEPGILDQLILATEGHHPR